jgi:DNA-binding transcriptional MerR regulator
MATGMDDNGRGLFAISVAAELTGLHPQTLRIYEREGLVTPSRSDGGTRRYSRDDIDRLNEIATLMATGMNLVGVRRVLELQTENARLHAQVDETADDFDADLAAKPRRRAARTGPRT